MLPLMAASVVAYFIVRSTRSGSMYEITEHRQTERERLRASDMTAKGTASGHGRCASDFLSRETPPITPDVNLGAALQRFIEHQGDASPSCEA